MYFLIEIDNKKVIKIDGTDMDEKVTTHDGIAEFITTLIQEHYWEIGNIHWSSASQCWQMQVRPTPGWRARGEWSKLYVPEDPA